LDKREPRPPTKVRTGRRPPTNKPAAAPTKALRAAAPTKALRDAERLVNRQTEKSEVNKHLVCIVDPELGRWSLKINSLIFLTIMLYC
jgi:hypothetical protein